MLLRNLGYKLFGRRDRRPVREGTVDVPGGKIWFQLHDERLEQPLQVARPNGRSDGAALPVRAPLVAIHGGPGFPHNYLLPLKGLAGERPVLFYDQLGCGNSDRPEHEWCWSVPRYVAELSALLNHLDLPAVHLLGHSWGAVVAYEYAAEYPERVVSLTYASPALNIPRWIADAHQLRAQLSAEHQEALRLAEHDGTLGEHYQSAVNEYYRQFVNRLDPLPPEVQAANDGFGAASYRFLWGLCEPVVNGTLREYDATPGLAAVGRPVWFTCGRFDEATPETCAELSRSVPGSRMTVFEQSAHLPHLAERQRYQDELRRFLAMVECGQAVANEGVPDEVEAGRA